MTPTRFSPYSTMLRPYAMAQLLEYIHLLPHRDGRPWMHFACEVE